MRIKLLFLNYNPNLGYKLNKSKFKNPDCVLKSILSANFDKN